MSRVVCSQCGAEDEERAMVVCQRCGTVICPQCSAQGGQYCLGCQAMASSTQELL